MPVKWEILHRPHDLLITVLAEGLIRLGVISQSLDEALDPETGDLRKVCTTPATGSALTSTCRCVQAVAPLVSLSQVCASPSNPAYFGAWRPDVDCPERYANIRIRIEDDVLITTDGPVVLMTDCPKSIDDILNIVGQDLA